MQRRPFLLSLSRCTVATVATAWSAVHAQATSEPDRAAVLASVGQLFIAIETSDSAALKAALDPGMVGLAQLRDDIAQLMALEKRVRYHLSETTIAQTGNTAVVKARWERRFLLAANAQAQVRSGSVALQFTRSDGTWLLAGFSGDNPFDHGPRR